MSASRSGPPPLPPLLCVGTPVLVGATTGPAARSWNGHGPALYCVACGVRWLLPPAAYADDGSVDLAWVSAAQRYLETGHDDSLALGAHLPPGEAAVSP